MDHNTHNNRLSPLLVILINSFLAPDIFPGTPLCVTEGGPVAYPLLARKHLTRFNEWQAAFHRNSTRKKYLIDGKPGKCPFALFPPIPKDENPELETSDNFDFSGWQPFGYLAQPHPLTPRDTSMLSHYDPSYRPVDALLRTTTPAVIRGDSTQLLDTLAIVQGTRPNSGSGQNGGSGNGTNPGSLAQAPAAMQAAADYAQRTQNRDFHATIVPLYNHCGFRVTDEHGHTEAVNVDKPAWATRLVNILAPRTSGRWNINYLDFGTLLTRLHRINANMRDIGTLWEEVIHKCGRGRNDIWDKATELDAIALGCECLPHLTHPCGHLRMEPVFAVQERTPGGTIDFATTMSALTLLHRTLTQIGGEEEPHATQFI